jgi:hypothetical protein
LWLLPATGGVAQEVASPLFGPDGPPNYYGQVQWLYQYAWDHD